MDINDIKMRLAEKASDILRAEIIVKSLEKEVTELESSLIESVGQEQADLIFEELYPVIIKEVQGG